MQILNENKIIKIQWEQIKNCKEKKKSKKINKRFMNEKIYAAKRELKLNIIEYGKKYAYEMNMK